MFLLDAKDKIQPQVSRLARPHCFAARTSATSSFEKLIAPLVTREDLERRARLHDAAARCRADLRRRAAESAARCRSAAGQCRTAASRPRTIRSNSTRSTSGCEPRTWLVRVTDITARVQQHRELEDLRAHMQTQGEILRSVLQAGGARFGAFLQRTDAAMKTINGVLKKPAREAEAFRSKLEETLEEVDRVRRDAAALKLTGLEARREIARRFIAGIAQPRRLERQRFPAAGRQARPALRAIRAAALADLAGRSRRRRPMTSRPSRA